MDDVVTHEDQTAVRTCASCGASLRPDARFCASCGHWIGAPAAVEEPSAQVVPIEDPVQDLVEDRPADADVVVSEHPGTFEEWRELEELRVLQGLDDLDDLDEHEQPDEIEEITELHSMAPSPQPGVQPVSLSREPMTRPRRVIVAIALLMLFAAIAVALRTVG